MGEARLQGFTSKTGLWTDLISPGDSQWQDGRPIAVPYTVMVEGMVEGDAVQVRATNKDMPSPGYLGLQVGDDVTADGFVTISEPYARVRVIRTAVAEGGGGSVSVRFYGNRPPMS